MSKKVEVGQVWSLTNPTRQFRITRIGIHHSSPYCWGERLTPNPKGAEELFGPLTADGFPAGWANNNAWRLEEDSSVKKAVSVPSIRRDETPSDKMLRFFQTSAHPDVCGKCGAPVPCAYHP